MQLANIRCMEIKEEITQKRQEIKFLVSKKFFDLKLKKNK